MPRIVASLPSDFVPRDVALSGRFALFAPAFPNAVSIVDISTPTNPIFRAVLDFASLGGYAGTGMAVTSKFVYLTGVSFIMQPENGTTGDTRLFIGQYLATEDTAGIPPTVSIIRPHPSDAPMEGQTITLRAEAADDIAVASVSFLVNGEVVFTATTAPFEFMFTVPVGGGRLTITAQAIDFGSNIGMAQDGVVTVMPDPPPTVAITSPPIEATVIEGTVITLSADATDNGQVVSVLFTVNGVNLPPDPSPPLPCLSRFPSALPR